MKRGNFKIANREQTVLGDPVEDIVSGLVTENGLCGVYRDTDRYSVTYRKFSVTHIPTGWRLALFPTQREARALAVAASALAGIESDSVDDVVKVPGLRELLRG